MSHVILAAVALYLVQIYIGPLLFFAKGPFKDCVSTALGSRDQPPPYPPAALRARRAADNMQENLLLFLPLALLAVLLGADDAPGAVISGWVFVVARALYVPAYIFGWSPWRSVIFGAGFLATLALGFAVALAV